MTKRTPGPDPFNNPFSKVKLGQEKKPEPHAPKPPPPAPSQKKEKPVAIDAEAAMFLEAMGAVVPKQQDRKRVDVPTVRVDAVKVAQDDAESMAELAELVSGDGPLEVDENEGHVPGFDPQVVRRLRTGGFKIQGTVDLHGLTRDRALAAVDPFIVQSRREGKRCVLVITGKGINSEDQVPVLRNELTGWLSRGKLARYVLAFCPAQPADGGSGAVYVLLRR